MKITITTQVALELLTNHALKHSDKPGDRYFIKAYSNVIKEAVEKETPMKPRKSKTDIWQSSNYCDVCDSFVGTSGLKYRQSNYCSGCGQKIDWDSGDE